MIRKLTTEEINELREMAQEYSKTLRSLEEELAIKAQGVKQVKAQISESQRYFGDIVSQIVSGEVEEDEQKSLPL